DRTVPDLGRSSDLPDGDVDDDPRCHRPQRPAAESAHADGEGDRGDGDQAQADPRVEQGPDRCPRHPVPAGASDGDASGPLAPGASAAESGARARPAAGWARCGVAPVRGGVGLCPVRGGVGLRPVRRGVGPCPVPVGICPVYGPEALNRATTTRMARVNILDFRGETLNKRFLAQWLPRAAETHADIERRVADLLETVAAGGSAAVQDFTERFDGVRPDSLRVPDSALAAAEAELDPRVK